MKMHLYFNVFRFGDIYYRQKEGGTMGSLFSCLWAILTFATMETLVLIPKYEKNIVFFLMYSEDIFIMQRKQGEPDHSF